MNLRKIYKVLGKQLSLLERFRETIITKLKRFTESQSTLNIFEKKLQEHQDLLLTTTVTLLLTNTYRFAKDLGKLKSHY